MCSDFWNGLRKQNLSLLRAILYVAFEIVKREVTQLKHLFVLDLGEAIDNDECTKWKFVLYNGSRRSRLKKEIPFVS